jgi:hypothetical protein
MFIVNLNNYCKVINSGRSRLEAPSSVFFCNFTVKTSFLDSMLSKIQDNPGQYAFKFYVRKLEKEKIN